MSPKAALVAGAARRLWGSLPCETSFQLIERTRNSEADGSGKIGRSGGRACLVVGDLTDTIELSEYCAK